MTFLTVVKAVLAVLASEVPATIFLSNLAVVLTPWAAETLSILAVEDIGTEVKVWSVLAIKEVTITILRVKILQVHLTVLDV